MCGAVGETFRSRHLQNIDSIVYYLGNGNICILAYNKKAADIEKMKDDVELRLSAPFNIGGEKLAVSYSMEVYGMPDELPNEWSVKNVIYGGYATGL